MTFDTKQRDRHANELFPKVMAMLTNPPEPTTAEMLQGYLDALALAIAMLSAGANGHAGCDEATLRIVAGSALEHVHAKFRAIGQS